MLASATVRGLRGVRYDLGLQEALRNSQVAGYHDSSGQVLVMDPTLQL